MAEEYVTKSELAKLEKQMTDGFSSIEKQLDKIMHNMEVDKHTDLERYDSRYLLKQEDISNTVDRLSNPKVRIAAYSIVCEYLNTPEGVLKIDCMIDSYFSRKRDSTTKWVAFLKGLFIVIIAAATLWGGSSVHKSTMETQERLIETMQSLQGR